MQTGNTDFIYKNEFDKACFQHDMGYEKSKDLIKRTQSDKVLKFHCVLCRSSKSRFLKQKIN